MVRVLAGEHQGVRGPARTFTPIAMLDAKVPAGARLPVTLPAELQRDGGRRERQVRANGRAARAGELVLFANDGDRLEIAADEDAHVIVLSGEPIGEPVVPYGPFVMNSIDEIRQAFQDLETGGFGPLPEDA